MVEIILASIVRWVIYFSVFCVRVDSFVLRLGVFMMDCFQIDSMFSIEVNHLLVLGIFCRNELCCGYGLEFHKSATDLIVTCSWAEDQ